MADDLDHLERLPLTFSNPTAQAQTVRVLFAKDYPFSAEFDLTYGRWGGVPAASHAQLSLIGWGWNQLWEEAAIGSWGVSGGLGYVPITFTGLRDHRNLTLSMNGTVVNQSVHGRDYWQTDYDSAAQTWSITYNVCLDSPEGRRRPVRLSFGHNSSDAKSKI